MLGGQCPFQICANHSSGISIYFRARGSSVSLEVFDEHYFEDLPDEKDRIWEGKISYYKRFEAGYLSFSEAFYAFYLLWSDAKETTFA